MRLVLLTGGRDFFATKDPVRTEKMLRKSDPRVPVVLYHHPEEGHMPSQLEAVLGPLIQLACSQD